MQRRTCLWGLGLLLACDAGTEMGHERPYPFDLQVVSAPGETLAGAEVVASGKVLARSDARGMAHAVLSGREGARIRLQVKCPAGHRSTKESEEVVLRKSADGARPQLTFTCPSVQQKLALVVRAAHAAGLPLTHRGTKLATLDAQGVAHVLLKGEPGDMFDVSIDTSTAPALRPAHPGGLFAIDASDQVALFEPDVKPMTVPRRKLRRDGVALPQRIR